MKITNPKNLTPAENKKKGIQLQINKLFGKNTFSNVLYNELTKEIDDNTSNKKLLTIIEKLTFIDLATYTPQEEKEQIKPDKTLNYIKLMDKVEDAIYKLKEDKLTKNTEQKNMYTELLTNTLNKTIQQENEKVYI